MQRIIAILLCALLLAGLYVPAMAAAESADERLARVTQSVKDTLALDTDAFDDFHGDVYEQELGTVWSLRWSGGGTTMNVEALEDGTVLSYWRSDSDTEIYTNSGSLPALPKQDVSAAKKAAESFLARVLDPRTESVVLDEPASAGRLNSNACRFYGSILLNGLPSPLSYSIVVRGGDNVVTSFRRDALATSFLGNIPSAQPAVSLSAAAEALRGTLKLELIYVTSEDDESRAVLRYVPRDGETVVVDAQTGELVTPDGGLGIYAGGGTNDAAAPEAAAVDSKRGLTEAELAGVEKLEGVLDSAALDKAVRAESAYKLGGYTLASANYRLVKDGETERVLCTLHYAAQQDDDGYARSRTFTADARTGKVESLDSSAPWNKEQKSAVSLSAAQSTAESFLKRFSAHADAFALYDTDDSTADGAPFYSFTFTRKVNGYFFPENSCTLQIDRMTGAVAGISYTYDEKTVFDGTDGIISADAALGAWMASYDVTLAYRSQPKELDPKVETEAKLIDMGYTRFRTLLLSYGLEREGWFPGVDAKTGKVVESAAYDTEIAYGDVAGHWAEKELTTLADCGVGYAGGSFRPDKALTQWELVALLASTQGLRLDPDAASADERDNAYETVYRMGALTRAERKDDHAMTRAELVKSLLDCAGYGAVAKLPGIFTCSYTDRASIPAAGLGYAALAQGFGLVTNERFDGSVGASRAMAAVMLYRLMQRDA